MDDIEFGNALVANGLLRAEELREALWERQRAERAGGAPPFLWDIIIDKGYLSRVQVDEALGSLQKRGRYCAACNVAVPVPSITTEGERCGRCGGRVSWRILGAAPSADGASPDTLTLIGGRVPEDVHIARGDRSRILGKYVLVEEAGHGGAGVVYKAWDTVLGQYVALKLIKRLRDDARLKRDDLIKDLLREARNAVRLRHANIVPVFDAGRIGDEFFICMEYVDGDSLGAHMRAAHGRGRLSPLYEEPLRWLGAMRDVCGAIHYAHTFPKPIVHCDLKPGNILIDAGGKPYLVDFGLAQPADVPEEALSGQKGHVRGTPAYMSPEQLTGRAESIGPWTDIYALGVILYELMAGRPVFGGSAYEILMKALREAPKPPLETVASSGEVEHPEAAPLLVHAAHLEGVILQCLAKEAQKRPQSALQIADELTKIMASMGPAPETTTVLPDPLARGQALPDEQMTKLELKPLVQQADHPETSWEEMDMRRLKSDRPLQARILAAFTERMVARLNERRPRIARMQLLDRLVKDVEVLRATKKALVIFERGRSVELLWAAIAPLQIVGLAADVLKMVDDPRDRLALGIYCLSAQQRDVGRQFLTTLKGTTFEPAAEVLLRGLPE